MPYGDLIQLNERELSDVLAEMELPSNTHIRTVNFSRNEHYYCIIDKKHPTTIHSFKNFRYLKEIGIGRPVLLQVQYPKIDCKNCHRIRSYDLGFLAPPGAGSTHRVRRTAVGLYLNMTLEKVSERMKMKYHVHVAPTTVHDWVNSTLGK